MRIVWTHSGPDGGQFSLIAAVEKEGKLYLMRWISDEDARSLSDVEHLVKLRFLHRNKHLYKYILEDMQKRKVSFPEEYVERLNQQEALESL